MVRYTVSVDGFSYDVVPEKSLNQGNYDAVVYVSSLPPDSGHHPEEIRKTLIRASKKNHAISKLKNKTIGMPETVTLCAFEN